MNFSEINQQFSPSINNNIKQYQMTQGENSWLNTKNPKLNLGAPFQTHTIKQKLFNKPRPMRPYERFIPTKIALTGVDPSGNINEFISNDIIHPMKRPNLYIKTFSVDNSKKNIDMDNRWALKTTAKCNDRKSLPKLQPFVSYYFPPKYNNKDIDNYRKFSLKTDHIGIQVPRCEKVSQEKSFIKLKTDYYFNTETKKENEWVPLTCKNSTNNISSKDYNIINFKPLPKANPNPHILLNKTLYFKKKGIGEFADLTKTFRVNFNKEFADQLKENPYRFRKYQGIFSDMYDSSHKNGDIITPFGKNNKIK
jgi:hypothetical protein